VDLFGKHCNEQAVIINSHRVDVLVELNGQTQNMRLDTLSHRPARLQVEQPVACAPRLDLALQIHYMGYGATNGALYIQAYLSDRIMTPADLAPYYSEKLFILPVPFYVTSYKADAERQQQQQQQQQHLHAHTRPGAEASATYATVAPVKYPTVAGDTPACPARPCFLAVPCVFF
jgi:predicted O-linked N-acetylglucosamine transferase (SPINDLY family)